MSDIPDIEPGEAAPGLGEAALIAGAAACLSCGARIAGPFCVSCGQKNDDMRRSSLMLVADFFKDSFSFDSRMWRTLGLLAAAPGTVPANYSHGKRSRYTPPVRLFLVVSFLFFLTLGLTHTMFVAIDVSAKTAEEIASERERMRKALEYAGAETLAEVKRSGLEIGANDEPIIVEGEELDCDINFRPRFFVRPQDLSIDEEKWRACSESITAAASAEIERTEASAGDASGAEEVEPVDEREAFERAMAGIDKMIANPVAFNSEVNAWLPRVLFFMAPVLALLLALFIRGKDALLFDHLVLSLYFHAVAFAIFGAAILLGQFGAPHVFPVAMGGLALYLFVALKRAYRRGWIKTFFATTVVGLLYLLLLASGVSSIIANQIWRAAA